MANVTATYVSITQKYTIYWDLMNNTQYPRTPEGFPTIISRGIAFSERLYAGKN